MNLVRPAGVLVAGLMAALLAGCETTPPPAAPSRPAPPPPPPRAQTGPAPYRAADFAWSVGKGPGGVAGVVNYRTSTGERWSCSGQTVGLTPETDHSAERIGQLYGSRERAVQSVSAVLARSANAGRAEYGQFLRDTPCEAGDTFNFRELPDGAYFLIVRVHPPAGAGTDDLVIMQRVVVRGAVVRVSLPPGAGVAPQPARPAPPPPPRRR